MATETQDRQHTKAALTAAKLEIEKAIGRVDTASGADLAALRAGAIHAAAFVDFNSGCGKAAVTPSELIQRLRA